jgi:hypothetical protein
MYDTEQHDGKIHCTCSRSIGVDNVSHFSMDLKAFTYTGSKVSKLLSLGNPMLIFDTGTFKYDGTA